MENNILHGEKKLYVKLHGNYMFGSFKTPLHTTATYMLFRKIILTFWIIIRKIILIFWITRKNPYLCSGFYFVCYGYIIQ